MPTMNSIIEKACQDNPVDDTTLANGLYTDLHGLIVIKLTPNKVGHHTICLDAKYRYKNT